MIDRQKILTIFGVAWLSAALLTWFLWSRTKAPKQEATVKIAAAARELPAGTRLGKAEVKLVTVLQRDMPSGALTGVEPVVGRTLLFPMAANEPITAQRLSSASGAEGIAATIDPGMRAVSVPFTDSSGVAGLIQPRSHVDVFYTRTGSVVEAMTVTVLENVRVLSIGRTTEVQPVPAPGTPAAKSAQANRSQNQTAVLLVTPEQAKRLELAKNQGKLSLALRNPLDNSTQTEASPATLEQIEPLLLTRSGRRGTRIPSNLNDPKAWANLIGEEGPKPKPKEPEKKEPPKPRWVVDVFRGDKHVQEVFQ